MRKSFKLKRRNGDLLNSNSYHHHLVSRSHDQEIRPTPPSRTTNPHSFQPPLLLPNRSLDNETKRPSVVRDLSPSFIRPSEQPIILLLLPSLLFRLSLAHSSFIRRRRRRSRTEWQNNNGNWTKTFSNQLMRKKIRRRLRGDWAGRLVEDRFHFRRGGILRGDFPSLRFRLLLRQR